MTHRPIPLWGDRMPPYPMASANTVPTVTPYLADHAKYAVVIFPGGGYFQLSVGSEGVAIAKALNARGIAAFVVTYRYAPHDGRAILADGHRAMQFVRYHADAFGIAKRPIALMGFSAGGHLAMCVAEHSPSYSMDTIGKESHRPDACILGYPVVTMGDGTFPTMPRIFLGEKADDATMIAKYSYPHRLAAMPATFLWYSKKDTAVDYEKNAEALFSALCDEGIPTECHAFADGGHGIGLGLDFLECAAWLDLAVSFMDLIFLK